MSFGIFFSTYGIFFSTYGIFSASVSRPKIEFEGIPYALVYSRWNDMFRWYIKNEKVSLRKVDAYTICVFTSHLVVCIYQYDKHFVSLLRKYTICISSGTTQNMVYFEFTKIPFFDRLFGQLFSRLIANESQA